MMPSLSRFRKHRARLHMDMRSRSAFSREQLVVVALMMAFSVMSYFDRTIMSIAGPQIMKEFDLSATQMGSVYSAFILSYAIMMIPGGHVVDQLGPRLTLLVMGLSAALFTGLTVVLANFICAYSVTR